MSLHLLIVASETPDQTEARRRQTDDLIAQDMARDSSAIEDYAALLDELHNDASRRDIAWRIGIDDEITDAEKCAGELRSFLRSLNR